MLSFADVFCIVQDFSVDTSKDLLTIFSDDSENSRLKPTIYRESWFLVWNLNLILQNNIKALQWVLQWVWELSQKRFPKNPKKKHINNQQAKSLGPICW